MADELYLDLENLSSFTTHIQGSNYLKILNQNTG